ncbi:hypothetical protein M011DRAFT_333796 [Sporormia fimetaria CBS 119925]|uniref:Uncharacterized protein n=1 Tax=Sporormia fimetaria CBS 119925 TaxID=1340428 RepID=A0A6A6VHJ9_9PLEO|nr:hypothetical protein M011DRAFT_333796 [Sporormia fimetaria CBS 119925]
MSLRRQSLSPTANLLRNSRLFSLPNPLPRPPVAEPTLTGAVRQSDTATLPYPTHQAIATTPSSFARGDWGLKRPLPARSIVLKRSKPVVRVKQWDTIEHVTDYESATDHVRTLEKFQALHTPVMRGMGHFSAQDATIPPPRSAFEKDADVTSYEVDDGLDGTSMALQALRRRFDKTAPAPKSGTDSLSTLARPNLRWKHDGPWLPGMGAEEFTTYITHELSKRREEFNKYMTEFVKTQIYAQRSSESKNEPLPLDEEEAKKVQAERETAWSTFTKADIKSGIRSLREKCAADPLNSDLVTKLITPFLRLPPIKLKNTQYSSAGSWSDSRTQRIADDSTPNSTHPSAGLGYLRTKAYLTNHPILGPQELPAPITARVVQPRKSRFGSQNRAKLGVAGFIADDEFTTQSTTGNSIENLGELDVDTPGGRKVTVQTQFASVSSDGKVHIKVRRSHGPELAISKGELDNRPPGRKNVDRNPMANLDFGKSGIRELDEAQEGKEGSTKILPGQK